MNKSGRLFVISAPSGSGKTTVLTALLKRRWPVERSVSATTRPARPGEKNGRDYYFFSRAQFEKGIRDGIFLEHARILGQRYGTPRTPILRALRAGRDVLLAIDVQGARQIRRSGVPAVTIFLMPPSLHVLAGRLRRRGTETEVQILARLRLARKELREAPRYDYEVVNDRLKEAVATLAAILRAERHRVVKAKRR